VTLSDQFQDRDGKLIRPTRFCNPVLVDSNTNDEINNPAAHLTCYRVKKASKFKAQVVTIDEFGETPIDKTGEHWLDVQRGTTELCVPSLEITRDEGVSASRAASSLLPAASIDHYDFYKVKRTKNARKFNRRDVQITDQWLTEESVEVRKPERLGVPTSKNDEGILDSETHLTCYSLTPPLFRSEQAMLFHQKRDVAISNQFGEYVLRVTQPNTLCMVSEKHVVGEN
jgi:hypothetical protein